MKADGEEADNYVLLLRHLNALRKLHVRNAGAGGAGGSRDSPAWGRAGGTAGECQEEQSGEAVAHALWPLREGN